MQPNNTTLCACGCGEPLPKPKYPSRQRQYILGHRVRIQTYTRRPTAERFWEKVDKRGPDDCWEWQAYRDRDGYGHIRNGERDNADELAHRLSYELANGPILDGMLVCHKCDNPPCCNPAHLFLGTNIDNMQDCVAKGRRTGPRGEAFYGAKLTNEKVIAIRQRYAAGGVNMYELAAEYGVTPGHICTVIHRKAWTHI